MKFCEDERLNMLLETEIDGLPISEDNIPIFKGTFEELVQKYNGVLPDQLMSRVISGMARKLKSLKDI